MSFQEVAIVSKNISAKEMRELSEKVWASTEDIKKIGCIGKNKALEVKKEIREQMKADMMVFPRNLVGMDYVFKYFHIDAKKYRREIGGLVHG